MSMVDWIIGGPPANKERVVGRNHATLPDVANRPLRTVLTVSGQDPDADFAGFLTQKVSTKFVAPAAGFAVRNNADTFNNLAISDAGAVTVRNGLNVTAGQVTLSDPTNGISIAAAGAINFSTTFARIIPANGLSFRNGANNADNLTIADDGSTTFRSTITQNAGNLFMSAAAFTGPITLRMSGDSWGLVYKSGLGPAGEQFRLGSTLQAGPAVLASVDSEWVIRTGDVGNSPRAILVVDAFNGLAGTGALLSLRLSGVEKLRVDKTGSILLTTAASTLVPGATSFSVRNNANSADNLLITDAGVATFRNSVTMRNAFIKTADGVGTLMQVVDAGITIFSGITMTGAFVFNGVNQSISALGQIVLNSTFNQGAWTVVDANAQATAAMTGDYTSFWSRPQLFTGANTVPNVYGLRISQPTGTPTAVTNHYGIKIENLSIIGTGTAAYALFTGTGLVQFGDSVTIASISLANASGLVITPTAPSTSTVIRGINVTPVAISTVTTIYGIEASLNAQAGAYTITTAAMLHVTNPTFTVGNPTASTLTGLLIDNLTKGTSNIGVSVGSMSGTSGGIGIAVQIQSGAASLQAGMRFYGIQGTAGTAGAIFIDGVSATGATNYGIQIGNITGGPTANYAIYTNAGAVRFGDVLGVGSANPSYFINADGAGGPVLTGATQVGVNISLTAGGAVLPTTAVNGIWINFGTGAAAFTSAAVSGISINSGGKGAGSTITTLYGIQIADQTSGNTNFAIATGRGVVKFGDMLFLTNAAGSPNNTPPADGSVISLGNWTFNSGTQARGININPVGYNGLTNLFLGAAVQLRLPAQVFTLSDARGVYIQDMSFGAGPTVTTQYGLYIDSQTKGATNYAIFTNAGGVSFNGGGLAIQGSGYFPGSSSLFMQTTLTGAGSFQKAIQIGTFAGSDCTSRYDVIYLQLRTVAAAFAMSSANGVLIDTPSLGSGSSIGNLTGLTINPMTLGTITNFAIQTSTGLVSFGDAVSIAGVATAASNVVLTVGGTGNSTVAAQYGILATHSASNSATSQAAIRFQSVTGNAATLSQMFGLYQVAPAKSGTTTVATAYGMYFEAVSLATTNYAIYTNAGFVRFGDRIGIVVIDAGFGITVSDGTPLATVGGLQGGLKIQFRGNSDGTSVDGIYVQSLSAVAAYTVNGMAGVYIAAGQKGAGSTITTLYGLYIEDQTVGAANYAIRTGAGMVWFGDTISVSSTNPPNSSTMINIDFGTAANSTITGIYISPAATTSLTAVYTGVQVALRMANGSYTLGNLYNMRISSPTGTPTAVTNHYGLKIEDILIIGTGTFAYAVFTGKGQVAFGGAPSTTGAFVGIGANYADLGSTSTDQQGLELRYLATASATGAASGIRVGVQTKATAFTVPNFHGIYIESALKGAGSTITTLYGLRIDDQTVGGTNFAIKTGLGLVQFGDNVNIVSGKVLQVNATQVVSSRRTGWTAWTGTADRTSHNADTPATATQLGQALKALIDDLIAHGLIGT